MLAEELERTVAEVAESLGRPPISASFSCVEQAVRQQSSAAEKNTPLSARST